MSQAITKLEELKRELGPRLLRSEQVAPPAGLSTGWPQLDRYLLWQGFPKGEVSLLIREAGGATTLWEQSAAAVTQRQQWAAWVDGPTAQLTPWSLRQRHVDLSKLVCVSAPADVKQALWVMQELMSLCLFELIGCDLGEENLKEHQVLKLKKLALRYQTGVVLLSSAAPPRSLSFYALVLHFRQNFVHVNRALHRPTPHILERRALYADTLPLFTAQRRSLCG